MPLAGIDRIVLTNSLPHGNSGWDIYSGGSRYQALVLGEDLVKA